MWGCRRLSLFMVLPPFWHYFQSTYQQTNGNKKDWPSSNFSLQYHPWITHEGDENKRNDHQLRKLLIVWQILLVSALKNVQRTVWRICILILECKGEIILMIQIKEIHTVLYLPHEGQYFPMLYECWERKQIFNVLITILVKKKILKKCYNKLQAQWCTYTSLIKLGPSEKSYQRQKKA